MDDVSKKPPISRNVGSRLASSSDEGGFATDSDPHEVTQPASPVSSIGNLSTVSHATDQSVMCHQEEDANSLNEGFMIQDEDGDASHFSANVSHMDTTDGHGSDSVMSCDDTTRSINLSRCSTLKRGQPNTVKAGLLHGEKRNVVKLRRSFGLDKSEIGDPIPLVVPDIGCKLIESISQTSTVSTSSNDSPNKSSEGEPKSTSMSEVSNSSSDTSTINNTVQKGFDFSSEAQDISSLCNTLKANNDLPKTLLTQSSDSTDSLLSGQSRQASPTSPRNVRTLPRTMSTDSGKGSLLEESGVIDESEYAQQESKEQTSTTVESRTKLDVQKTVETDSNLTEMEILDTQEKPSVPRTAVTDAPVEYQQKPAPESNASITVNEPVPEKMGNNEQVSESDDVEMASEDNTTTQKRSMRKSISSNNFRYPSSTCLGRSHSIHESSMMKKHQTITPNLQVSGETHKLLSRAGYLNQKKSLPEIDEEFKPLKELPEDFKVMGPPPVKNIIPNKRESIMQLQINMAGRVKNSIRDIEGKHTSPYRFPNSVSAKKGMSPLRVPSTFAKKDKDGGKGFAKVPISTQLLKPSEKCGITNEHVIQVDKSRLTRKPSIYYAKDKANSIVRKQTLSMVVEEKDNSSAKTTCRNKENKSEENMTTSTENDEVFTDNVSDTVDTLIQNTTKLNENLSRSSSVRRTSSSSRSSPHKPVKRLGSPGSPHRHNKRITSPGRRIKTSQLSAVPHHLQDDFQSTV